MIYSSYKRKEFDEKDAIRILNAKQAAFYWNNGVSPLDIYPSLDFKTGEPVVVFLFSRSKTQETGVYDEWVKRKQDVDNG